MVFFLGCPVLLSIHAVSLLWVEKWKLEERRRKVCSRCLEILVEK
jgi:hypothetical protein